MVQDHSTLKIGPCEKTKAGGKMQMVHSCFWVMDHSTLKNGPCGKTKAGGQNGPNMGEGLCAAVATVLIRVFPIQFNQFNLGEI